MKNKKNIILSAIIISIIVSCSSITPGNEMIYCGYELKNQEYTKLRNKVASQKSPYEVDTLWNIYDQINDSVRSVMPDSIVFEIFLTLLNDNEVGIDIYCPKNEAYFEKIGCAIMTMNYTGKIPEQRYMFLYSYTNPDGSGDMPLEVAIKRKN